jgi:hypothetical protein
MPRSTLLEKFKEDVDSVLFGTDSFWQGVDVPGEALSNVIITRLPFAVPDHPLIQARLERIEARGGNSFFEFSLPVIGGVNRPVKIHASLPNLVETGVGGVVRHPQVVVQRQGNHPGALIEY